MTKLKLFSVYCLMAVVTLFFAACGSDDNDEIYDPSDSTASALIGTWYMDEYNSITFNKDGSGMFKTSEYDDEDEDDEAYSRLFAQVKSEAVTRADNSGIMSISFRWKYTANPPQIRITMQGKPMVWKIVSVSENSLVVVDDDGETVGFYKKTEETPVNPGKIGPKELLYGDWGAAGKKVMSFDENGSFIGYDKSDRGRDYKFTYIYDDKTNVISVANGGAEFAKVVALTPTLIGLKLPQYSYVVYLSRINENEEYTIGSFSLIYDKKLTLLNNPMQAVTVTFRSNGKCISPGLTYDYTYDKSTHKLTLLYNSKVMSSATVIKLTEDGIILGGEDEMGQMVGHTEYVAI